jgi:hypothetical protein
VVAHPGALLVVAVTRVVVARAATAVRAVARVATADKSSSKAAVVVATRCRSRASAAACDLFPGILVKAR